MATMIDTAAAALVKAQSGVECFPDLEPEAQELAREHVRAVLRAVREPSALAVENVAEFAFASASREECARFWREMIDALLAE